MKLKKLRAKTISGTLLGISSFSESEFELLKQTALDKDNLDDTFANYRANVENVKAKLLAAGARSVIEVPLTVAEVEAYCQQTGKPNIGATRAELVQSIVHLHVPSQP